LSFKTRARSPVRGGNALMNFPHDPISSNPVSGQ
jgi:hypothetical protein